MKEIQLKHCFNHIFFVSGPIWMFLGSLKSHSVTTPILLYTPLWVRVFCIPANMGAGFLHIRRHGYGFLRGLRNLTHTPTPYTHGKNLCRLPIPVPITSERPAQVQSMRVRMQKSLAWNWLVGVMREVWWEGPLKVMTVGKFGDVQRSSSWETKLRRVVESLSVTGCQESWVLWQIM